jgi:hypothetical protein
MNPLLKVTNLAKVEYYMWNIVARRPELVAM